MRYLCTLLVSLLFCLAGMAQQIDTTATIQTSDGETYTGKIIKYEEGKSVTIVQNGRGYILDWSMIKSIKSADYSVGIVPKPPIDTVKRNKQEQKQKEKKQVEREKDQQNNRSMVWRYYRTPRVMLGLGFGWGAPYGLGIDASVVFKGFVDVNAGMGFDLGGFRIGIGSRVFILGRRVVNPYLGIGVAYNSGLNNVFVEVDGAKTYYKVPAGAAIHFRGGMRFNTKRLSFLINGGYGIPLSGFKPVVCTSCGYFNTTAQGAAATFGPGNLEVSFSLLFRIAHKYVPLQRLKHGTM